MQRDLLIKDLAQSFGMLDVSLTKYSGSHYDKATGTLYCNGMAITKGKIDRAKKQFEKQMYYYKDQYDKGYDVLEMLISTTVAFNAIVLLEESVEIQERIKG